MLLLMGTTLTFHIVTVKWQESCKRVLAEIPGQQLWSAVHHLPSMMLNQNQLSCLDLGKKKIKTIIIFVKFLWIKKNECFYLLITIYFNSSWITLSSKYKNHQQQIEKLFSYWLWLFVWHELFCYHTKQHLFKS